MGVRSSPYRARRDVGTLRLNGRGSPKVSREVLLMYPAILSMSMLAAGMIAFSAESGLIMRPLLSLFFLMYTQIFLVTSVRGIDFPPQTAANAGLRVFGAKSPTP